MKRPARSFSEYPMERHGAVFVPLRRLDVPRHLIDKKPDRTDTNHHYAHPAKTMGRLAITQTFRDLDANQEVLPRLAHNWLHDNYLPPRIPNLTALMERLDQATDSHELLRYGTAHRPLFRRMGHELWEICEKEYNSIHLIDRSEYA